MSSTPMSPFDEGVAAATAGKRRDDNPHKPGTAAHSDWDAGYASGRDADEATELDDDPNHRGPYAED